MWIENEIPFARRTSLADAFSLTGENGTLPDCACQPTGTRSTSGRFARLTAREREILTWVARGKTNPEIARVLWVAPSTVRKHLENVYAKLGVSTRAAAVARFLGAVDAMGAEEDTAARA